VRHLPDGSRLEIIEDPAGNRTVLIPKAKYDRLIEPPAPQPRRGETQWYVPYTAVHPATVAGAPDDAIWVNVAASPLAYYGALLDIWGRGETFATLEHDVICRPDVIQAFEECPEPWCCFGYSDICCPGCMEAWANELGCTRFRREIIEAVPDAVSSAPRDFWDWHIACDGLGRNLRAAGFTHHWHFPPVEHHHLTDGVHGPSPLTEEERGLVSSR
jgi:hypothetical protein